MSYMRDSEGNRLDAHPVAAAKRDYDVVVVGGSEVGVLAAVGAARQGAQVLLICDSNRVGGVTGWSLTQTDMLSGYSGGMIFGLAREYCKRVGAQRTGTNEVIFERFHRAGGNGRPSQWARAFNDLIASVTGITIVYSASLTAVSKTGTTINSVTAGGITYTGRIFIEATPTGELIRQAGLSTSLGREPASLYTEATSHVGIQNPVTLTGVDPYVTPGNSASGLIFGVDSNALGTVGAADTRIMASGTRTYITNGSNKTAWPAPTTYDATKYELIARIWAASAATYNASSAATALNATFLLYDVSIAQDGSEYDLNHRLYATTYPVPTDWQTYVDGTAAQKATIATKVRDYFLGLVQFILTSGDARVPANLKTAFQTWGPSSAELVPYGGVSPQVYVREGRRLIGDYVLNQTDAVISKSVPDVIAFGAYNFDCKDARYLVQAGAVAVEGAFGDTAVAATAGFPIPYRVLTPKVAECTNLLSPGQPSVSRYIWTAVRGIPVMLTLGHVAGVAAALAAKDNLTVQNVAAAEVRTLTEMLAPKGSIIVGTGFLGGNHTLTSGWNTVSAANQRWPGYAINSEASAAANATTIKYIPNIPQAGTYRVLITYPATSSADGLARATNATVRIVHGDGTTARTVNQQYPGSGGGWLEDMGTFYFAYGSPSAHYVEFDASAANGSVVDGIVVFVPVRDGAASI